MVDPVGTRERRDLASFRRSDPPQEGGHQGVVVEIEGVHVDVGGQWTVINKDRDRLRGGLDPTGEAIGVVTNITQSIGVCQRREIEPVANYQSATD